jgi:hypothetical protein
MAVKNVTELDYERIRSSLRTFLQNQDEFSDYNFEASGLSTLVDLLAYNTHYNAVLAHMVSNEAFLDSAVKRNSVVSIAKTMGYTPRSARAAAAVMNITVFPSSLYTSSTLTLQKDKLFSSSVNGISYNFIPSEDYTVTKSVIDDVPAFRFENVRLVEGTRTTTSEIINSLNFSGPVVLINDNVDTTTIRVRVQNSISNQSTETFTVASNVLEVTSTSSVFYIEERTDGYYQILFGDGVLGKKLEAGNIAIVDYIVTNGSLANGARVFNYPSNLTGTGETINGTLVDASAGGFEAETADSIRFNAPRFNAAKGRTITKTDYETTIKNSNPNIKSVSVWGGEDNIPAIYGKVFISMQPQQGYVISDADKQTILNGVLEPRMPVGLLPEFVDPEYVQLGLGVTATFDDKLTTLSSDALKSLIVARIENFFDAQVNQLKKNFYLSKLTREIGLVSDSIVATNVEMRLIKKIAPTYSTSTRYEATFNNKIMPLAIRSNYFTVNLNGSRTEVSLGDVPNPTVVAPVYSGTGTLVLKSKATGEILAQDVGTVDYDTGKIDITGIIIENITGLANNELRIICTPHESARNISVDILVRSTEEADYAVEAFPAKNIILQLDDSSEDVVANIRRGLSVTMIPRVSDE